MEAAIPLPEPTREVSSSNGASTPPSAQTRGEAALVPSVYPSLQHDTLQLDPRLARLAVELDVSIPAREFRVRNLLALEPGQVIRTQWQQGEDMPLAARGAHLAWSEFEVIDSRLAVRIARLV
jgi:flagellar motor switch protein FliN/FliY